MKLFRKIFLGIGFAALFSANSLAQSAPPFTYGFVPTTAQWVSYFAGKQDYLGALPLLSTGGTMTGPLVTAASTAASAGFNIAPGVLPTTPNNGDMWVTAAGLFVQINGATVGPIGLATSFTSLAINGCVIGANNFCVTGNIAITGTIIGTSGSANALAVGLNGVTNPAFSVDSSAASQAAGIKIVAGNSGGGAAIVVTSTATNEALAINAKGSGTINIGNSSTGNINLGTISIAQFTIGTQAVILTGAGPQSLVVGPSGVTNPTLQIDDSTASAATGLLMKSAAAAGGMALSTISSGTNENLTLDAKGSGTVKISTVSTGGFGFNVGSDATGDTYYRSAGGLLVRVPIGSNTQVWTISGGVPTWQAGSSAASITVGTTTVNTCGASTNILFNNGGTLGCEALVPAANGGTGVASPTAHSLLIAQGASAMTNTGTGTLGQALVSGGGSADPSYKSGVRVLLNTLTASSSANLQDTTSLTSSYNDYEIVFENVTTSTAASGLQILFQSGGTFQTSGYISSVQASVGGAAFGGNASTAGAQIASIAQATTGPGASGIVKLFGPVSGTTTPKKWTSFISSNNSTPAEILTIGTGYWNANGAITGVEICWATTIGTCTGTIVSGTIKIYGVL